MKEENEYPGDMDEIKLLESSTLSFTAIDANVHMECQNLQRIATYKPDLAATWKIFRIGWKDYGDSIGESTTANTLLIYDTTRNVVLVKKYFKVHKERRNAVHIGWFSSPKQVCIYFMLTTRNLFHRYGSALQPRFININKVIDEPDQCSLAHEKKEATNS